MQPNNALTVVQRRAVIFKLITPSDVKVYTGMAANINDDNLQIPIQTAQTLKIKKILGETLYGKLRAAYITAGYDRDNLPTALTTTDGIDYQSLYDQIVLPLAWWAYIESIIGLSVKVDEKGVMYNGSDYSENAQKEGYFMVVNRQTKIAEAYTDTLIDYICETFKNDADVSQESIPAGKSGFMTVFPNDGCCKL